MSGTAWLLLATSVSAGAALGAVWAGVARRIPDPGAPLFRPRSGGCRGEIPARWDPASLTGAVVPVAAAVFAPGPAAALAAVVVGWLLLGIAVCDERTLHIPHAPWIAGTAAGLLLAWGAGGWAGAAGRAATVLVLDGGLLILAVAARAVTRRAPIGVSDYGVLAFVGAVCGLAATVDVVLTAAVMGLGVISVRGCGARHRLGVSTVAAAAAAASVFLGAGGAAAGAGALGLVAARTARPGRRARPVPFGACLAAGTVCVILASAVPPLRAAAAVRNDLVLRHLISHLP